MTVFVGVLALLLERLLERCLAEGNVNLSAPRRIGGGEHNAFGDISLGGPPICFRSRRGVSVGSPQAREVMKALGICDLKPATPPKGEETIM